MLDDDCEPRVRDEELIGRGDGERVERQFGGSGLDKSAIGRKNRDRDSEPTAVLRPAQATRIPSGRSHDLSL